MAIRDLFNGMFRRGSAEDAPVSVDRPLSQTAEFEVGYNLAEEERKDVSAFNNSNITWQGELKGFDYDVILRNKQKCIIELFRLADYYFDADPIIHGIVAHVFVPYCSNSEWYLTCANNKTVKLFNDYYRKIRLREKIADIFTQLAKYNNCYVYLLNGTLITLPVHKCRIGNTTFNGQPIVEFDCKNVYDEFKYKGYTVKENWITDSKLEYIFKGYPPEIIKGLNEGAQYVQLNPNNTYVLQGPKEGWLRYAVPFVATALPALARKELIKQYEESMLNIGARSFVHVRYGDEKAGYDILPNKEQLIGVGKIFKAAMGGKQLAVTNQLAKAEVISADMSDLYQWPMYTTVNEEILSAGGISGIIVNGVSDEGSTFSTAQVSMQTAESRINAMRREFEDMMTWMNDRFKEYIPAVNNLKETPEFHFEPLSMTGEKAMRDTCQQLWTNGVVSTKTLLNRMGYSYDVERKQRQEEAGETDDIFTDRATQHADKQADKQMKEQEKIAKETKTTPSNNNITTSKTTTTKAPSAGSGKVGRPKEEGSNSESSARGSMPKPSNPNGSGEFKT